MNLSNMPGLGLGLNVQIVPEKSSKVVYVLIFLARLETTCLFSK